MRTILDEWIDGGDFGWCMACETRHATHWARFDAACICDICAESASAPPHLSQAA
jgi:hypothetical protein